MNWKKLKEPLRVELIHDTNLIGKNGFLVSASKENPVPGTVTHYRCKKIGRNNVTMYDFHPDIEPDGGGWEFSSKWFRKIKESEVNNASKN